MKPQVDFFIPSYDNEEEGMMMHFTSVSQIDDVIESLNEARIELARQIEMKRINNREKRKRRKQRLALDRLNVRECLNDGDKKTEDDNISDLMRKAFLEISKNIKEDILKREAKRNPDAEKEEQLYKDIMKHYDGLDDFTKSIMRPIIEQVEDAHKKFCESKKE